jgi:hypothetical protein
LGSWLRLPIGVPRTPISSSMSSSSSDMLICARAEPQSASATRSASRVMCRI